MKVSSMQMRNFALWALIIALFLVMFSMSQNSLNQTDENLIKYHELVSHVEAGDIKTMTIDRHSEKIVGEFSDGKKFKTNGPVYEDLVKVMNTKNIPYSFKEIKQNSVLASILINVLPIPLHPSLLDIHKTDSMPPDNYDNPYY